MANLIDVEAAIERARKSDNIVGSSIWETSEVINFLEDEPIIDAVPVIRCKDCARADLYSNRPSYLFCMEHHRLVEKDDFCSCGERK